MLWLSVSGLVATNTAGNCLDALLKISGGFTLKVVETQS